MTRNRRTLVIAGALLALAACKNPADDKPKAEVGRAKAPAAPQTAPAAMADGETLTLSAADSKVGWVGSKVTGSHEGEFKTFSGSITLAGGQAAGGGVSIEIDMGSVVSDADKLTKHLKTGDFFEVEKFPTARFTSTEVKAGGADGASHTISGDLDLHGITRPITFPATITVTDGEVTAASEFSINRKDFQINYAGRADDLIRDEVVIKLDIRAPRGA